MTFVMSIPCFVLRYFRFTLSASTLTPELTGREEWNQAFNPANEREADFAPVE